MGASALTAVVTTRDRIEKLRRCVDALASQDCEIIIVDNGSADGTLEYLE